MADPQYSDIPAGAQIVSAPDAGSNPAQQYSDLPRGAQVVQPSTSGQTAAQSDENLTPEQYQALPPDQQKAFDQRIRGQRSVLDPAIGFVKGAGDTIGGAISAASKLMHKIPGVGETLAPEAGIVAADKTRESATQPTNFMQKVGYGGEALTEFMLGDEALKGMSLAKKLGQVSKVMSLFEESPRLMKAAQLGAAALRQGTVQGAQTLAKTGGDVGEAAKEGAEMGAASGVLGGAGSVVGGLLEKGGKAAGTVETLGKVAEAAPTKEEVTEGAKNAVDTAKQTMHNKFEAGVQDLKERLGDAAIPHADTKIAETAKELITPPEPAEHGLVAAAKSAAGDRLDKPVTALLKKAAAQEGDAWKAGDLIDFRQAVRKLADTYPPGDPNARALYKLLPSVDDSLGKLASVSGDDTAKADYAALRKDYKDKIKFFQPSGKLEDKVAYQTANALRGGGKDDIGNYILSGGNTRAKVDALQELLGPEGTKQIGKNVFSTMVADSKANPANLVKSWNRLPEEARTTLFDTSVGEDAIKQLMTDTKSAAHIQQLMRAGVAGSAGAVGASLGGFFGHTGIGTLLGLVIGEGSGGFANGRKLLDYVANHPAVWKSLGIAGKVAEAGSSASGQALGTVVKQQAGRGLANVLQGASQPMAGDNQ
jgi:hypothetical protein